MTNSRSTLLGLVLLCAFGCQEAVDPAMEIVKFDQVSGKTYADDSQDLPHESPDGEYIEARVATQELVFSQREIERRIFVDLCHTKIATGFCSEIWHNYPLFTVVYDDLDMDEGVELLIFFGDGGSAEFFSSEKGNLYPDAVRIEVSTHSLADNDIEVPVFDEMPGEGELYDIYWYARNWFEDNEPQRDPDEVDAIL